MQSKEFSVIAFIVSMGILFGIAYGGVWMVMTLWNLFMPTVFYVSKLTMWSALGLVVLLTFLKGFFK